MSSGSLTHRVALVTLILGGCGSAGSSGPEPTCPPTYRPDSGREARLVAMLEGTAGARYLRASRVVCFGRGMPSAITEEGVVLLDEEEHGAGAAARLAHLLMHRVEGQPLREDPSRSCETLVDEALQREARAYVLELRLRDALNAGPSLYTDLEAAFREGGESAVLRYLRENPEGGPGLDGLGWGYRVRCEDSRGSST